MTDYWRNAMSSRVLNFESITMESAMKTIKTCIIHRDLVTEIILQNGAPTSYKVGFLVGVIYNPNYPSLSGHLLGL